MSSVTQIAPAYNEEEWPLSSPPYSIMPEVPGHIQDGLANMELESRHSRVSSLSSQPTSSYGFPSPGLSSGPQTPVPGQGQFNGAAHPSQSDLTHDYLRLLVTQPDLPTLSPFPKLENAPPNIPPSDEDKEATLDDARLPVLNSNDPEMQLAWAHDALQHVDAGILLKERLAPLQQNRPQTPQVEHQLRVDAMNVVNFLADQHHPKAEFMRGMWLEFGKFGYRQDKREAFRCYSRAADRGYARAEYRIGMQYEQSNDPIKALIHYNKGVEAGDTASNYRLGMMTLLGQHGQAEDFGRGVQLIRHAAETADENFPQGAYVYGMLLSRDLPQVKVPDSFLPFDENAARVNIEKAAFLGFAKAQVKMGSAYELCTLGCDFSPAYSIHYNALASRQGEAEADMALSKWFLCGYETLFQKNEELAYSYAQRAAMSGLSTAEFALGYFNEIGMYVPVNLNKAQEWYRKAAEDGNQDAVQRIDSIKSSNTLSKQDHENVAISRIKSQYGSKRGQRPDRFKQRKPELPTISSEASDFPDFSQGGQAVRPPRSSSTAPYPSDERPSSVAPYPVGDGPATKSPSPGGFLNPEMRSASAAPPSGRPYSSFNVNTDRPASAMTLPAHPAVNRYSNTAGGPSSPRQGPGLGEMGAQRGRVPPNQRVASGGPLPPRPDIGYAAPLDPSRGGRMQTPPVGYNAPPEQRPPRGRSADPNRSNGPSPVSQRVNTPVMSGGLQNSQSAPQLPAHPDPVNRERPTKRPGQAPAASGPPKPGLPGKGPKTFDEMGVPNVKQKSDCATDISANLHNAVTKAAATKLLKDLHDRKEIEGRTSGKQIIYHAIQDPSDAATAEELAALDAQTESFRSSTAALRAEEKTLRSAVTSLSTTVSTSELCSCISNLEAQKQEMSARLEMLKGGTVKPVSQEAREKIETDVRMWEKIERNRRKIRKELWSIVREGLPEGMAEDELK
ncbi:MAG: hypothetical protein M1820_005770, partial [Bogoriella megaspora]